MVFGDPPGALGAVIQLFCLQQYSVFMQFLKRQAKSVSLVFTEFKDMLTFILLSLALMYSKTSVV